VASTSLYGHWPAVAFDAASTIYLVWDTDARKPHTIGGCDASATPAPNAIMLTYSTDGGQTWARPFAVAQPANARVFWPWIVAGDAGRVSVVWYQTAPGELADLDCQPAHVYVYDAQIFHASDPARRSVTVVKALSRFVHQGTVCQGGTTCVATGQDRRLGDFFTNALDARGCVLIATGDTRKPDPITGGPRPTALPLFIRQDAGPSLTGQSCG
jgi:hypothetical protein